MSAIDFPARFPRIPHLPGSAVNDDDRVLPADAVASRCKSCLVVAQEKLDGANVGVMIDGDGKVVCLKRAGVGIEGSEAKVTRRGSHHKADCPRYEPEYSFYRPGYYTDPDISAIERARRMGGPHGTGRAH